MRASTSVQKETNPVTLIQRYERLIGTPIDYQAWTPGNIDRLEREIPRLEQQSEGTAFPKEAELVEKSQRLQALEAALKPKVPEEKPLPPQAARASTRLRQRKR